MGKGLLIADGDLWHKERKLITPLFHYQQLKTHMLKALCDEIPLMIQDIVRGVRCGQTCLRGKRHRGANVGALYVPNY